MPVRTSYKQGTPCWVDLQSPDTAASKAFYAGLFGWSYDDMPMPQGPVYSMAKVGDHVVAAIAPQPPPMAAAGAPPAWNTYLAVDSVDDSVAKATTAGGQVAMPAMDVMEAGRMAFVLDPGGAPVGLWQAGQHIGATLVNEPGAISWNELINDNEAAAGFYGQAFGVTVNRTEMGGGEYTMFEVDGAPVGGATRPPMPGLPNFWNVYFAVADADETAAAAAKAGGEVLVEPFDIPVGRIASLRDPRGAMFSVITSRR